MAKQNQLHEWHELVQQLRVDSIRATTGAGSGHPTSSMFAADLMAVLLAKYLHYDFDNPHNPNNDRFILSKGHAAPVLYAMFKAAEAISDQELLPLRKFGSPIEGHPVPVVPWVDVASGSLGQGLPIGMGITLVGKYLDKFPYHIWVVLGDNETAEGAVWEAFDHASHYNLDNLIAIIDVNRLGQRGQIVLGWNTQAYAARARAFGWHAIEIDGQTASRGVSGLTLPWLENGVTTKAESVLGKMSDVAIGIAAAAKQDPSFEQSRQFNAVFLFEQSTLLLFDALFYVLAQNLNKSAQTLWALHTNLE